MLPRWPRLAAVGALAAATVVALPSVPQAGIVSVDGAVATGNDVHIHRAGPGSVRVSWSARSMAGVRAWQVEVVDSVGNQVTRHRLLALPARRSLVVHGLPTGSLATATVAAFTGTDVVNARPAPTAVRVPAGVCAGVRTACISADAAETTGRERHIAQGLLHGLAVASAGVRRLHALNPRFWRITEGDSSESQLVRRYHADTTALLSDAWRAAAHDPLTGRTRSPWQDWTAYRSFVVGQARARRAHNDVPDYWEVQNEPDNYGYYNPQAPPTPALLLRQFRVAYSAIRSVLPAAKVIGPSLAAYNLVGNTGRLGLADFIDYATRHKLHFAAISWHELNAGNPSDAEPQLPQLADRVQSIRTLLAASPVLRHAKVFINEFDSVWVVRQVGWDLGHVVALEDSHVAQANRSCFELCASGADSLLNPQDGTTPRMTYWGRLAYAQMTGERLATTTSDRDTTAMATTTAHRLAAIVTRHNECAVQTHKACPAVNGSPVSGSGPLTVVLRLPYAATGRVTVTTTALSPTVGDVASRPVSTTRHERVGHDRLLRLRLASVASGAATVVRVHWR